MVANGYWFPAALSVYVWIGNVGVAAWAARVAKSVRMARAFMWDMGWRKWSTLFARVASGGIGHAACVVKGAWLRVCGARSWGRAEKGPLQVFASRVFKCGVVIHNRGTMENCFS